MTFPKVVITAELVKWAKSVVWKRARRYRHLRDDLESEALIGLWQAALSYRPSEVPFRAWAHRRIQGAVSDWLRNQSLAIGLRTPSKRMGKEIGVPGWVWDDIISHEESTPEDLIDVARSRAELSRRLAHYPHRRTASMLSMRIYGERTLKEIGKAHGVTEARACQVIGAALNQLTSGAVT